MKIRTQKDVEALDKKIKDELGIDVRKYRNEEVIENFGELLVFPAYIVTWAIRSILFAIFAYIIVFFLIDSVYI